MLQDYGLFKPGLKIFNTVHSKKIYWIQAMEPFNTLLTMAYGFSLLLICFIVTDGKSALAYYIISLPALRDVQPLFRFLRNKESMTMRTWSTYRKVTSLC